MSRKTQFTIGGVVRSMTIKHAIADHVCKPGIVTMIILFINIFLTSATVGAYQKYVDFVAYDNYFSEYTKLFFGDDFDWLYFKAQAIAESNLNPHAESVKGAVGIMQIMPSTFDEITRKNPDIMGSLKKPRWNIAAGIYYNRLLWEGWHAKRSFQERINFMFASYNAGRAGILKAQKLAMTKGLDPTSWENIQPLLREVSGAASRETIEYVQRIHYIKEFLK